MFNFVQNWLGRKANPIGIDFGTDCLRMAQVHFHNGEPRLFAAASAEVPAHVRHDPVARFEFFTEKTRELLVSGKFRGRSAILALPAASTVIHNLQLPRGNEVETKAAILREANSKLPMKADHSLIRHLIAGEIHDGGASRNEVIVLAAARAEVNRLLNAASAAKLTVIGMNVEPRAIIDCFSHVYRRNIDSTLTNCFIDMGASGTRVIVARNGQIHFARSIAIGGDHFNTAVARAMNLSTDEARLLRLKLGHSEEAADVQIDRRELHSVESAADQVAGGIVAIAEQREVVEKACSESMAALIAAIEQCRGDFESTFPAMAIDRLHFVGGESRDRGHCQQIARSMKLNAQLGDPLVRMGKQCDPGFESGIDRRHPQPAWAVAIGLSLGTAPAAAPERSEAIVHRQADNRQMLRPVLS